MKTNQKSKFNRIILGINTGWKMSTLPDKVNSVHTNPLCRIFRVIGGICISIVVTRHSPIFFSILSHLPVYIAIPVVIIALLHLCYIAVISFIRLKYIHYLFKNNKLEIRN